MHPLLLRSPLDLPSFHVRSPSAMGPLSLRSEIGASPLFLRSRRGQSSERYRMHDGGRAKLERSHSGGIAKRERTWSGGRAEKYRRQDEPMCGNLCSPVIHPPSRCVCVSFHRGAKVMLSFCAICPLPFVMLRCQRGKVDIYKCRYSELLEKTPNHSEYLLDIDVVCLCAGLFEHRPSVFVERHFPYEQLSPAVF